LGEPSRPVNAVKRSAGIRQAAVSGSGGRPKRKLIRGRPVLVKGPRNRSCFSLGAPASSPNQDRRGSVGRIESRGSSSSARRPSGIGNRESCEKLVEEGAERQLSGRNSFCTCPRQNRNAGPSASPMARAWRRPRRFQLAERSSPQAGVAVRLRPAGGAGPDPSPHRRVVRPGPSPAPGSRPVLAQPPAFEGRPRRGRRVLPRLGGAAGKNGLRAPGPTQGRLSVGGRPRCGGRGCPVGVGGFPPAVGACCRDRGYHPGSYQISNLSKLQKISVRSPGAQARARG